MLLRSAPESGCIDFAKKIIVHLAREKRGKKKGTARREVDEEMRQEAREMVYSWLKRNSLLEGEELE